jgi:hypothetical protein
MRLSINPANPDNGKEDSYERLDPQVCFCEISLMASPFVFNLSFSEFPRVQKNLLSGAKKLFRHAENKQRKKLGKEARRCGQYHR